MCPDISVFSLTVVDDLTRLAEFLLQLRTKREPVQWANSGVVIAVQTCWRPTELLWVQLQNRSAFVNSTRARSQQLRHNCYGKSTPELLSAAMARCLRTLRC